MEDKIDNLTSGYALKLYGILVLYGGVYPGDFGDYYYDMTGDDIREALGDLIMQNLVNIDHLGKIVPIIPNQEE
jgi:hypothetical protein